MVTQYKLEDIVKSIEDATSQKAYLDDKFGLGYIIYNVDINTLETLEFKYIGDTEELYFSYPIYQKGNIMVIYRPNYIYICKE